MAVSPFCSFYLEGVQTGQQGHDNEPISHDIDCALTTYKHTTLAGTVTDNSSTNKKKWELLKQRYSSRFFQGCTSHDLHLLVKDKFCASKTKKAGSTDLTYSVDYLFEDIQVLFNECKDIANFLHDHEVAKVQLQEMQKDGDVPALVQRCPKC